MFGQPTTSPFSTPGTTTNSTPFGAPAASTTAPAFGSPAPAFGTGGGGGGGGFGFGSPPAAQPAPAPSTGFGGFGSTNTATPTPGGGMSSGFGGGFGSPPPTTNASTGFGATNNSTTTPFGAPAPATGGGLFGSAAPAPSGGGLFGSTTTPNTGFNATPAPSTGFGGGGGFGSTTNSGGVGFGAANTQSTAPAFGSTAAPTGGLFGSAPAPATSGFGSTTTQNTGFGAPAPAATGGGLFGSTTNTTPAPATSGFGFGSTQPAGNTFNNNNNNNNKPGTLSVPYEVTRREDGSGGIGQKNSVLLQSITAMPTYESKSFEELRMEDYMSGNKGAMGQAVGGFGATATNNAGGGLFGSAQPAPAQAFGAPASTFGSPTPAPAFGGSAFGATPAPVPATGGFSFGSPTPAPAAGGLFGSTPAPAAGGGLFGGAPAAPAPATSGGLFGTAPAPAAGGLFGSTPAPATGGSLFGATPAPAPAGGLFGATPAPAPGGSLFGATPAPAAPVTGGLFGATPAAPAPSAGFSFGSPTPAPGLFGAAPAAPAPATGLFGAPPAAPATGGLFGATSAPAATGGLFGPTPATGGLFGATPTAAPVGGSMFGSAHATTPTALGATPGMMPGMMTGVQTGITAPPAAEALLAQQLAAVESQKKEMAVLEAWRGSSPHKSKVISTSSPSTTQSSQHISTMKSVGLFGSSQYSNAESSVLSPYRSALISGSKIRPRGFGPLRSNPHISSIGISGSGAVLSPSTFIGSATKQLVIKPSTMTPKPKMRLLLSEDAPVEEEKKEIVNEIQSPTLALIRGNNENIIDTPEIKTPSVQADINSTKYLDSSLTSPQETTNQNNIINDNNSSEKKATSEKKKLSSRVSDEGYDFYQSVIDNGEEKSQDESTTVAANTSHLLPKLSKDGYIMSPPLEELSKMTEAELATVSDFFVERVGYGSVAWEGAVDVREVDLDHVIEIESKDVRVYDDDEQTKPAVGSKLNRPAILTILNIFPKDGKDASAEAKDKFERRIVKTTKKMGAELISYDIGVGEWKFRVLHFSRYGLDDDDSDEENEETPTQSEVIPIVEPSDTTSQGEKENISHFHAPDDEQSQNSEESDVSMQSEGLVLHAAEKAYDSISQSMNSNNTTPYGKHLQSSDPSDTMECEYKESLFADEGELGGLYFPVENVTSVLQSHRSLPKISRKCFEIASRCGIVKPTSSKTDFGLRFGRSFRVGWRPDGSLLCPKPDPKIHTSKSLMQIRPELNSKDTTANFQSCSKELLSTHLKHSVLTGGSDKCPTFSLPKQDVSTNGQSQQALHLAVHELGTIGRFIDQSSDTVEIINSLLSLSLILFGNAATASESEKYSETRRIEALKRWIRGICSADVEREISSAISRKDSYGAVFAALSGGNKSKAASIAIDNGLYMLSSMITNSNAQAGSEIYNQLDIWNDSDVFNHLPQTLYRIYSLLSQNLDLEEKIYSSSKVHDAVLNWKRRIGMLLLSLDDPERREGSSLSSILSQYESDVINGLVPPPRPVYMDDKSPLRSGVYYSKCTLYRLIELYANTVDTTKSRNSMDMVVSPLGYTDNEHDFSSSFFLSTFLAAFGVCEPLSDIQETQLLDSFASQLVNVGLWEYAVYVVLYSFGQQSSNVLLNTKKKMAMEIVFRYFTNNLAVDPSYQRRRTFLEEIVGIPTSWFEQALSYRSIYELNPSDYVKHTVTFSVTDALQTYEENVLPILLVNGGRDCYHGIIDFLDSVNFKDTYDPDFTQFSGVVYCFINLSSSFTEIASGEYSEDEIDELSVLARRLSDSIQKLLDNSTTSQRFPGLACVPVEACLVELSLAVDHILKELDHSKVSNFGSEIKELSLIQA